MRRIEHGRCRSELPSFRFLYCAAVEELGIKLVPGLQHEVAKGGFTEMSILKLATHEISDTMHIMGSTKLTNQSGKSKEADESFIPHSRPRGGWPSLVIEIGVSESLTQLRRDAKFWLEDTGGQVNIVIIIAVKETTRRMTIERWENRGSTQPQRQACRRYDPICVQALKLRDNGQLSGGTSLFIPATKVFDTLPAVLGPNDFTFTRQDLAQFIQRYWNEFP